VERQFGAGSGVSLSGVPEFRGVELRNASWRGVRYCRRRALASRRSAHPETDVMRPRAPRRRGIQTRPGRHIRDLDLVPETNPSVAGDDVDPDLLEGVEHLTRAEREDVPRVARSDVDHDPAAEPAPHGLGGRCVVDQQGFRTEPTHDSSAANPYLDVINREEDKRPTRTVTDSSVGDAAPAPETIREAIGHPPIKPSTPSAGRPKHKRRHLPSGPTRTLQVVDLHDATLVGITLDWAAGHLTVALRTATGPAAIRASGVSGVEVPRHQPWGPSASVNEVRLGDERLEIAMQSGDQIVIEAQELELP
jgi:hypothetical protein